MWTVAVVMPGPNFLAAARIAAGGDRRAGMAAVAGIGAGTMIWGLAGCFGLRALLALAPWLYAGLKLLGAGYLVVVGARMLAASFGQGSETSAAPSRGAALSRGFVTSISNPKSALFVGSLFAAVLPADAPLSTGLTAAAEMVTISVAWYTLVVCLLSTRTASSAYLRLRRWIDGLAGVVFLGFGGRLLLEPT